MRREKQIDEIAKLICTYPQCTHYNIIGRCEAHECIIADNAERVYNAGYRKQAWISVDERMPDSDGKYLVYTGKDRIHTMYYYVTNAFGFEHWDVTHWMPLPEAPKMKGGEHG